MRAFSLLPPMLMLFAPLSLAVSLPTSSGTPARPHACRALLARPARSLRTTSTRSRPPVRRRPRCLPGKVARRASSLRPSTTTRLVPKTCRYKIDDIIGSRLYRQIVQLQFLFPCSLDCTVVLLQTGFSSFRYKKRGIDGSEGAHAAAAAGSSVSAGAANSLLSACAALSTLISTC